MKRVVPVKRHLLVKRAKIINFLKGEGYSGADIAVIFNIDRSGVTRILSKSKEYKGLVKDMLSDVSE
jgi:DNA-binding MarR family transcriptional regulator